MSHAASGERRFVVTGVVEEEETGRPLPNLVVRAFDKDLALDDRLGAASTDPDGRFAIRFGADRFRDVWESRPDLYLRIYDQDGARLIHETTDAVRWNAKHEEHFRVRIPARALDPRPRPT